MAATFALLLSAMACPEDLPDAPAGFEWYEFEAGKGAYLKPDGWFVKVESGKGTDALFISKENIDEKGEYLTGMSVNVVHDIKARNGQLPSQYMEQYFAALGEMHKLEDVHRVKPGNGLTGITTVYRERSRQPAIVVFTVLMADDQTDTLRILLFEAPESEWKKAWVQGELMLKGRVWR